MLRFCTFLCLCLLNANVFANLPYHPLSFPRDEAAHYDNIPYEYKQLMEWWYINGIATTDDGRHISFDVAFFNPAIKFGGVLTSSFVHIQLADLDEKRSYGVAKELNRSSVSTSHLNISAGSDFSFQKVKIRNDDVYVLKARIKDDQDDIEITLLAQAQSEIFLINDNGLMPMQNNTNSYYYSIPKLKFNGDIIVNKTQYKVSTKPGEIWMDHQWGDFDVHENGWEWFSIRLENGLIANIFLITDYKNTQVIDGLANIILPNGEKKFISYKDFTVHRDNYWFDKNTELSYPLLFTLDFPSLNLHLVNEASFADQEVHGYWEGHSKVNGFYDNQAVKGYSFTELVYRDPASDLIVP